MDAPIGFLTRSSDDVGFIGQSNNNLLRQSNSAGELQNEYTHAHPAAAPISAGTNSQNVTVAGLYSRKHMMGGPLTVVAPSGIDIPETGAITTPNSLNYSASFSEAVELYAGEALWEAGTQAGYIEKSGNLDLFVSHSSEPWFNNYDSFKKDLRVVTKDEAVIPEFRISEHVADYEKLGINANLIRSKLLEQVKIVPAQASIKIFPILTS